MGLDEIEKIAEALRTALGPGEDILAHASSLGLNTYLCDFTDPNARVKILYQTRTIYLSRNLSPEEMQYYIARALGHWVLHMNNQENPIKEKTILGGTISSFGRDDWESEQFAACYLIPRSIAEFSWAKSEEIEVFSKNVGVSEEVARLRLQQLSLV
jgi:Zn-dependent peptidase ImmA (M78 family)